MEDCKLNTIFGLVCVDNSIGKIERTTEIEISFCTGGHFVLDFGILVISTGQELFLACV